jgi:hypothetical protein
MIRLDFDNQQDATLFIEKLRQLWLNRDATPALRGSPQVRILERMETTHQGPHAGGLSQSQTSTPSSST